MKSNISVILVVIMMAFYGEIVSMDIKLWNKWNYDTSLMDDRELPCTERALSLRGVLKGHPANIAFQEREILKDQLEIMKSLKDLEADDGLRNNMHRNADGVHILDIRKTWEKLQLSAREMVAPEFEQIIAAFRQMNEKSMRKVALLKLKEEIKSSFAKATADTVEKPQKHAFRLPREKAALRHKKRLPCNQYQKNKKLPQQQRRIQVINRNKR